MWIDRKLFPPGVTSPALRISATFYLLHLLCQGWIGSSQIFLGLALAAAIYATWKGELEIPAHPLYIPLAIYLIASLVSALASVRPLHSLKDVSEAFSFLTLPLAIALYLAIPSLIGKAIRVFVFLGVFLASYGLVQFFFLGQRDLEHRIRAMTAHVMTYSGIILPLSLLFLVIFLHERKPIVGVATILTTAALVLTFTRGAWVGWLCGFVALMIRIRPRGVFYSIPLLILAITFSPVAVFARLMSAFDADQSSNRDRVRMIQAGVEMVRDRPLTGVGPGNVKEIYPLYRESDAPRFRVPHLHNNTIQIWAERGVFALAAYVLLMLEMLRLSLSRRSSGPGGLFADAGVAVTVAMFAAGMFEFNFGDTEVVLNFLDLWGLIAAGIVLVERSEETERINGTRALFSTP